jgi:hypothetical protein
VSPPPSRADPVALSNLHATQGRSSTNLHARKAIELFERDFDIIEAFHASRGGKWNQYVLFSSAADAALLRKHT